MIGNKNRKIEKSNKIDDDVLMFFEQRVFGLIQ